MRGERSEGPEGATRGFGVRLLENLFNHRLLFVLPLLLFTVLGINQTRAADDSFESTALVQIGSNPNVGTQLVRGTNFSFRESAAEGTIRLIREQFGTRRFATSVTEYAGMGDQIGAGWGVLEFVRSSVELEPEGDVFVSITASWSDPETSLALVEATVDAYSDYLSETAATDAAEAERFYRVELNEAESAAALRQAELTEYVDSLPQLAFGEERGLAETVEVERRERRVDSALQQVAAAQARVDGAIVANNLAVTRTSNAFVMIDPPVLASAPTSTTTTDIKTIVGYFVMGAVVSLLALLVTTSVDAAVTAPSEVTALQGVDALVLVPPVDTARVEARRAMSWQRLRVKEDDDSAGGGPAPAPRSERRAGRTLALESQSSAFTPGGS